MNNKIINDDDQEEESLSLSDFPLISDEPDHRRRPSSQPPDFFEFSNDSFSDHISHAEDIISCGKLMPYKRPPPLDDQILKNASDDCDSINLSRRYCDSLPDVDPTRPNTRLIRSSRSLDSKKLRRNSSIVMKSEASDLHRNFSKGSTAKSDPTVPKPRWYGLMFGLPSEMDLRDMRRRQVRRIQGSMSPASEGAPANRRISSWGQDLLRVLSCRDHQSVALVPQI